MARTPLTLVLPVAFLLLAGCNAPGPQAGDQVTPADGPAAPAAPILAFTGCQGFHTFFTGPPDSFQQFVPDNFTLKVENGLASVPVLAFDCANGTSEMWALLEVVPPAAWQNASFSIDAVVLQAFTTNATDLDRYLAWGFDPAHLVHAHIQEHEYNNAGVAHDDRVALGDGPMKYEVRTTVQDAPGAFAATHYRYWVTNATRVTGWVDVDSGPATSIGAGTAAFQQQGDPGAPPVTVGIGHRVEDAGFTMAWHALP